jgi:aspartyl-tRNA(Asn)/glutamyl-tRNA(Gln) amidotransferase subunit C
VAVSERDVRHVAELARLGLEPDRIEALVRELNGILGHMDVLAAVDTTRAGGEGERTESGTSLREDRGPAIPLATARADFAPAMRDGFFLVPRLASHEDRGDEASP